MLGNVVLGARYHWKMWEASEVLSEMFTLFWYWITLFSYDKSLSQDVVGCEKGPFSARFCFHIHLVLLGGKNLWELNSKLTCEKHWCWDSQLECPQHRNGDLYRESCCRKCGRQNLNDDFSQLIQLSLRCPWARHLTYDFFSRCSEVSSRGP